MGLSAGRFRHLVDRERPVFLLGCSWRCGSTLLQRYINSTEAVFIWGENRRLAGRLIKAAQLIDEYSDYSIREHRLFSENRHLAWIALLNPPGPSQRRLLRGGLQAYYRPANRARGIRRWGFKEVREPAATAAALLEAFPKGRVIFLMRRLDDLLASNVADGWYESIGGAQRVATQWLSSTTSFLECSDARVLNLKYEDLLRAPEETTAKIGSHLGIAPRRFDRRLLGVKVGASERPRLGEAERKLLCEAAYVQALRAAGY